MLKHKNKWAVLFSLAILQVQTSFATEIIHYKNVPVSIELRKGEERSIQFGDHVKIGITQGQKAKRLFRIQAAQGTVHILAYKKLQNKERIQFKRISDGRVILIDFISTDDSTEGPLLENVEIVLESENVIDVATRDSVNTAYDIPGVSPVEMTRFVSQKLYGPTRLLKDVPGIVEITVGIKGQVKIFKGKNKYKTVSEPIIAVQGGGYYLTGIHIKNTSDEEVELDYRELNLPFSHATFQHHRLSPSSTPGDSTVLYLVFDRPLKESLYPWTYYKDRREELAREKEEREILAASKKRRLTKHR